MSNLLALRDAQVSLLRGDSRLRGVTIYAHGGDFTITELKRYAVKAPCVVVSALRMQHEHQGDIDHVSVTFVGVCITKDTAGVEDKDAVLRLVDVVTRVLGPIPDLQGGHHADDIIARNMYTSELNALGIAAWAMGWVSQVDLVDDPSVLVPFLTADVKYDLAPPDGSIEAEDLINIPT